MARKQSDGMLSAQISAQTQGELVAISRQQLDTLKNIESNLKLLNDHNILHSSNTFNEHKQMIDSLKDITTKYWWLIVVLIAAIFLVLGYKEVVKFIPLP